MRDGVTIYVDILRPAGAEKVPVIVAWSPYGKGAGQRPGRDGRVRAGRSGQRDRVGSAEVRGARPGVLVRAGLRDLQSGSSAASPTPRATACCGIAKRARTATT